MASVSGNHKTELARPFPSHPFQTDDESLRPVHAKIAGNKRLDADDIVSLYRSKDILAIGWMANFVRERLVAGLAEFCVLEVVSCLGPSGPEIETITQADAQGIHTLHAVVLVGSDVPLQRYLHSISALRQRLPKTRILAVSPAEVAELAGSGGLQAALQQLREAGLDGFRGERGGVFTSAARPEPLALKQQAPLFRAAWRAEIETSLTLGPGCWTSEEACVAELLEARALCDESPPKDSALVISGCGPESPSGDSTGIQEIKHIAIARLVLDETRHICVSWEALGPKLSQIALRFGASQLESWFSAGAGETLESRVRELRRLIVTAGREPSACRENGKRVVAIRL